MATQTSKSGWSIIEILIALAVFSVAISGLYIAMSSAQESLTTSMRRDMESAMVNTLVSEINPYDRLIETAYDQTTKQQLNLPDGGSVWYTRIVASETASADRKDVNVYFYRNQSDTTPYRQFRREVSPDFIGYNCATQSAQPKYVKDTNGNIYHTIGVAESANVTAGSYTNGWAAGPYSGIAAPAVTGTADTDLFFRSCGGGFVPGSFRFITTAGQKYNLIIGLSSRTAASLPMTITVNGQTMPSVDPFTEVGASKALVKKYSVIGQAGTPSTVDVTFPANSNHVHFIALEKAD